MLNADQLYAINECSLNIELCTALHKLGQSTFPEETAFQIHFPHTRSRSFPPSHLYVAFVNRLISINFGCNQWRFLDYNVTRASQTQNHIYPVSILYYNAFSASWLTNIILLKLGIDMKLKMYVKIVEEVDFGCGIKYNLMAKTKINMI